MGDLRGGLVIVVISLVFAFGIQAYSAVVISIARGWWILRWLCALDGGGSGGIFCFKGGGRVCRFMSAIV
jgi:hypothetical protein